MHTPELIHIKRRRGLSALVGWQRDAYGMTRPRLLVKIEISPISWDTPARAGLSQVLGKEFVTPQTLDVN